MTAILTAAQMRAAEERAMAQGTSVHELMQRAGEAVAAKVATQVAAQASACDVLILCGPGNNGGDGYVAAAALLQRGFGVRVACSGPPATDAARQARTQWTGVAERAEDAAPAAIVVDALFGTGLTRPLALGLADALVRLVNASRWSLAVDLPSGVDSDAGTLLSPVPAFAATLALGALKPAHMMSPAAARMGEVDVADIGVPVEGELRAIKRPLLVPPGHADHKYTRGLVTVVGGAMPGAAALATLAAAHAGAGYVQLLGTERIAGLPHAVVQRIFTDTAILAAAIGDARVGAVVIGPGLGHGERARAAVAVAVASGRSLVIDADALSLLEQPIESPTILTPHEAEFARLFGDLSGTCWERALAGARRSDAVVVLKGSNTIVAAPDGRIAVSWPLPAGLATAGTGDVLAGVCGTMLAQMRDPFAAACAAVWIHGEAARSLPQPFIADALASPALAAAVARCW